MIRIFGIGNPNRSDDAVGPMVLAALAAQKLPPEVNLVPFMGDGLSLTAALQDCEAAILIDAVLADGPVGSLEIIDCNTSKIPPQNYLCSSHGFGLGEAVEMARNLGLLPPRCYILGIRANRLGIGHHLSPAVRAAVPKAISWIQQELKSGKFVIEAAL